MNIVVINGTEQQGCTFAMKEIFLQAIGNEHQVTEYVLPRDCPAFCTGCKACFFHDISVCPHSKYTVPIWDNILKADLLVFVSPTYVFHVTAQMKALLDHFASKWLSHSPEKQLFSKQAVIITNAVGQGMGKTARDIKDSLDFWGIAHIYIIKQALHQVKWDIVDDKKKDELHRRCKRIVKKIKQRKQVKPRLKVKVLFFVIKIAHTMISKSEVKAGRKQTKDYLYWQENGWLDGEKPWKD